MYAAIKTYISPEAGTDLRDADIVATALNHLGYFMPSPQKGLSPLDPDDRLFTALRAFQRDHGLFVSGALYPGDPTEAALRAALATQRMHARPYVWRSVHDDRARSTHAARDGRIFYWNAPPEGGHPGEDYNCRCWAEPLHAGYKDERQTQKQNWKDIEDALRAAHAKLEYFEKNKFFLSAKFLRHYLGKTGTAIKLTEHEINNTPASIKAITENQKRFEDSITEGYVDDNPRKHSEFKNKILQLKDGESVYLKNPNVEVAGERWDKAIRPGISGLIFKTDQSLSTGRIQTRSLGELQALRSGNIVLIKGEVFHTLTDIYDFNDDTVWEEKVFKNFRFLAEKNLAKVFQIYGSKSQKITGTVEIENGKIKKSEFEWVDFH